MPDAKCEDCRYWQYEVDIDDKAWGTCRQGAPRRGEVIHLVNATSIIQSELHRGQIMRFGDFPWMAFSDWCGRYRPKKSIKKPVDEQPV